MRLGFVVAIPPTLVFESITDASSVALGMMDKGSRGGNSYRIDSHHLRWQCLPPTLGRSSWPRTVSLRRRSTTVVTKMPWRLKYLTNLSSEPVQSPSHRSCLTTIPRSSYVYWAVLTSHKPYSTLAPKWLTSNCFRLFEARTIEIETIDFELLLTFINRVHFAFS